MNEPIVLLKNISKKFGGIFALNDVTFDLENEIHSIIGHNGAGKSTLVRILMGALQQDSGDIYLNGEKISFASPREAQQNHIAMVWQELSNFPNLTVAENLLMLRFVRKESGAIDWKASNKLAEQYLQRINLDIEPTVIMGKLSLAQQQLVEFAKGLSYNPSVLILDEPTSALSLKEQGVLFEKIRLIKSQGVAIVFISHKLDEVMSISDRITVLRDGHKIFTEKVGNLNKELIVENIVGKPSNKAKVNHKFIPRKKFTESSPVVLDVNELNAERKLENVSFRLHEGEILGITGVSGSGISEIGKILFGMSASFSGKINLNGKPYSPTSPEFSVLKGIGYVPKERKEEGIIPGMSVGDNIVLSTLKTICSGGFILRRKKNQIITDIMQRIDLRPCNPEISISSLSGGNQQKVVMARWMSNQSQVLILDEPTRGVDVGSIQVIFSLLREMTTQGVSIIIISSEFEEVHDISDHIVVLNKGKVAGSLDPSSSPWEEIFALAIQ
jgi:ABC-type sugar transport system ATPase subunit